jgi:nucleoside-diphosphate-sugar epimerase
MGTKNKHQEQAMDKKRMLITGINGVVGSVLKDELSGDYEIFGIVRREPFTDHILKADIADYQQVREVFNLCCPEYVVHLAADSRVDADWDSVLHSNIIGTHNIYEAAREFKTRRIIYASTNHVTGAYEGFGRELHLHTQAEPIIIKTTDPIRPDSDYGVSKAFGEALARYYCDRWGIESICLRIGSVLRDDNPGRHPRFRKTWLSYRDLVQLVRKSLNAKVTFGVYYGVSHNRGAFWDISNARAELGYEPQDDGAARNQDGLSPT